LVPLVEPQYKARFPLSSSLVTLLKLLLLQARPLRLFPLRSHRSWKEVPSIGGTFIYFRFDLLINIRATLLEHSALVPCELKPINFIAITRFNY
jgi:hypothetical protein